MAKLNIKPKRDCMWDLVSLGEVMLRLDPGDERISTTRHFRAWEGGGEYNVARGLKRCFVMDTAIVTALADNPIGRLVEDLMLQGGVSQKYVRWVPFDGVGRRVRNGLNFTERGFGVRAALGCSDRGHTAISQLKAGDVPWDDIFGKQGARWLHTGGIFCALSATTPEVAAEAMNSARRNDWGAICYCDDVCYEATPREDLEIFDRVGGGDSFASGLIYGLLSEKGPQWAVECGAAHGALVMTTPGDTSMATLKEVLHVMRDKGARISR